VFEDCLAKGLIKRIQGREYGPNDEKPIWYKENQFCKYHQVKGHTKIGCYAMRKKLK